MPSQDRKRISNRRNDERDLREVTRATSRASKTGGLVENMPVLTYVEASGLQTNFQECKEQWDIHLTAQYGEAANLLSTGQHWTP